MTSARTLAALRRAGLADDVLGRLVAQGRLDGLELTERRLRLRLLKGHLAWLCAEFSTHRRVSDR